MVEQNAPKSTEARLEQVHSTSVAPGKFKSDVCVAHHVRANDDTHLVPSKTQEPHDLQDVEPQPHRGCA